MFLKNLFTEQNRSHLFRTLFIILILCILKSGRFVSDALVSKDKMQPGVNKSQFSFPQPIRMQRDCYEWR